MVVVATTYERADPRCPACGTPRSCRAESPTAYREDVTPATFVVGCCVHNAMALKTIRLSEDGLALNWGDVLARPLLLEIPGE